MLLLSYRRWFGLRALLFCGVLISPHTISETTKNEITFNSGETKTNTVVLFTSQGCSSCPPAEKWLNSYSADKQLWKSTIPLAFHVDYWDYLGWRDPFAKKEFSRLQRAYASQGHVGSVYTPGILINNDEFRQWFYGQRDWQSSNEKPGVLSVSVKGSSFEASFQSSTNSDAKYELHTAWVGMGISTDVTRGENRGKTLDHDFVVLSYQNHGFLRPRARKLESIPERGQLASVMVVWVTLPGSVEIIQAAAYPV